ncbi:MBL fold metallo-hydrolase RNA specificity domain-containing protein [Thiohalocapsa sp. ML1]|jgi:metallo-beta-lactamase family protein|uniref:MBL fold metallo-hydrolase RNA specificity domain-containing protein n=1 Tax=Thiohalocapsa sp. ML1 TaxID=1431688 RepID=UPI0007322475|nr:MBL fold metallo-hydrolase [Thiohalocapsa sp. ML1]
MHIHHHGAVDGVTGSCHQLTLADGRAVLIDCGLFQGAETAPDGAGAEQLEIRFPVAPIQALIVTHVHIDHVGRLPYLLAAGYRGPILCSPASAELLPLVLEDALEVGFTRNRRLIEQVLAVLRQRIVAVPYGQWVDLSGKPMPAEAADAQIRLQPAGHILGSAYVECQADGERVVFSGDLGAPETPLLPAPASPERADVLVLESTYGDRVHEDRATRVERLRAVIEHALRDGGTVLIPAFSIGRTQELLYELEELFHSHGPDGAEPRAAWQELQVVLDSPLAADFTAGYRRLRSYWDAEARARVREGRHPLAFEQLVTVSHHDDHLRMVRHLAQSRQPAVVIAASGMCAGGRVVNYLKALLGDARHDVLFVGYQAAGTPGRDIQRYGPRGGYVVLDGERLDIRARVHTIGGYSAHADQRNLIDFVLGIPAPPGEIRLVHGDAGAKAELAELLAAALPQSRVVVPG